MSLRALVSNRSFLVLLFGGLFVLPAFANQYTLFVGNLMMLYIILALGLNIAVGSWRPTTSMTAAASGQSG